MSTKIAIVGLGCRMPGAASPAAYWQNLVAGVESLTDFTDLELLTAGVPPEDIASPGYVKRAPVLDDVAGFDAGFFGFTPGDASITDPQQRILLEVCRDALDDSGLTLTARRVTTGVFASSGGSVSSYLVSVVRALADTRTLSTGGAVHLGNDKDFLSTRVSFKLDLNGPSLNVQTACSSSIVALHLACQSLLNGECDIAIAGASCVRVPQVAGYHPGADPVLSKDGRCRPFDVQASGTLFGSGAGAVVLRRLADAERDGDNILAVVLGTGINNDGGQKVSYTAASVPGQRACIESVLCRADVSADEISYVECHGTATKIGDPLEVKGLTQAFRKTTVRNGYCGIGSVKGNIGHLEQAAGLASLIKTVLMLKHRKLVPSLHCNTLNPKLNLDDSPFYVTRHAEDWKDPGSRGRTAGLSCLGMGGTNAFAVLREHTQGSAARRETRAPAGGTLFCLSAKSSDALRAYARRYATFLREGSLEASLAEIAYTTNISRTEFAHRLAMVVHSTDELAGRLERFATRDDGQTPLASGLLESVPDDFRQRYCQLTDNAAAAMARHEREGAPASADAAKEAPHWLGALYTAGAHVRWERVYQETAPVKVSLPTYPYQRKPYWFTDVPKETNHGRRVSGAGDQHP